MNVVTYVPSKWITGDDARRQARRLRAEHGCVLVGIGTVLADDPSLAGPDGVRPPKRAIADAAARLPLEEIVERAPLQQGRRTLLGVLGFVLVTCLLFPRAYRFEVPREASGWQVNAPSQLYYPAYRGNIWIDKDTYRVLRLEQEGRNIPVLFPFSSVETSVDYDFVRLGGTQSFVLPTESEVLTCQRGSKICTRNKIEFRNYRKFGAESEITFDR